MLSAASMRQVVGEPEAARASTLAALGFGVYDALHLACAESAGADVLLTTDDRFLKRAGCLGDELHVKVCNPVLWLEDR